MTGSVTGESRGGSALCSLQFAASALVLLGFFGPWIAHQCAALTVTGYQMSEFAKFFPQVLSGAVPLTRAYFITPLLSGVVSMGLVLRRSSLRPLVRVGGTALAALLILAVLPPHHSILDPAYRPQLIMVGAGVLLTAGTVLTADLTERAHGVVSFLIALAGAVPALWQFVLFRPLIAQLYRAPVMPGWGLIVGLIGFTLLSVTGLRRVCTA